MSIIPAKKLYNFQYIKEDIVNKCIDTLMKHIINSKPYTDIYNKIIHDMDFSDYDNLYGWITIDYWIKDILQMICDRFTDNGYQIEISCRYGLLYEITITW
jgi:hypothetical protein